MFIFKYEIYKIINRILFRNQTRNVDHLNLNIIFIIQTLLLVEPGTHLKSPDSPVDTLSSKISEDIRLQSAEMEISPIDSFTPLEAVAISCILEECLDQLALIGFMIPADVDPRWDDTFKTIDETYGVPDEPRMIFREDMGLLPIVPTEAEKMQKDRCAETHPHRHFIITLVRKCSKIP